jgi:Flp pilus assembly protein TadG
MRPEQLAGHGILVGAVVLIVALEVRKHRQDGQAIVETAILMAVLLPLALAAMQLVWLLAYRTDQQNATATLAAVAAQDGSGAAFADAVASESIRIGCADPAVNLTPASPAPGAIVAVGLRCTWTAPFYTQVSWPVSTSASALVPTTPSPSVTP